MTKSLTLAELLALHPCNVQSRKALYGTANTLTAAQAFARGATVSEVLWVMGALGLGKACAEIASRAAKRAADAAADDAAYAAAKRAAAYAKRAAAYAADAADAADAERTKQQEDIIELLED